jgi:hypothetical protein
MKLTTGRLAVLIVATALAFGGLGAALADWRAADPGDPIQLAGDIEARKSDADDDAPVARPTADGDGDDTRGDDGTNGGDNTGDGDNTRGDDGTNGGDNTGDGDNTRGDDGTSGGDNTRVSGGGTSGGGTSGGDT